MGLIKYLANLGYGSRREVTALMQSRRVTGQDGRLMRDDDSWSHDVLRLDAGPLDPPPGSVIALHKPVGFTCSLRDVPPLVYDLLPDRFRRRTPVMAPIGRLDRNTSGLLLLTDDGTLNHRLSSPKFHVEKTYRVTLAESLQGHEVELFASGALMLKGEHDPLLPSRLTVLDPRTAELVLGEGRYHQARRMFAAVGNHVVTLQRVAIGHLMLGETATGTWRVLSGLEVAALNSASLPREP